VIDRNETSDRAARPAVRFNRGNINGLVPSTLPRLLLDQVVPPPLGFENQFDRFAKRAAAAGRGSSHNGRSPQFFATVGHRHRQADGSAWRQVGQIVAT